MWGDMGDGSALSSAGDFLNAQKVTKDALRNYVSKDFLAHFGVCVVRIPATRSWKVRKALHEIGYLLLLFSLSLCCARLSC